MYQLSYGDGNSSVHSGPMLSALEQLREDTYRYNLTYLYKAVGVYTVSVNVTNGVSWLVAEGRVDVEQEITGIQVLWKKLKNIKMMWT